MDSDQLRLCPLCGGEAHNDGGASCMSPVCPMSAIVSKIPTVEQWNNAYCWKVIDFLVAKMKLSEAALEEICSTDCLEEPTVPKSIAKATLEKISGMQ